MPKLKADPTAWLLDPACPPVRCRTLTELLDRPQGDPEVQAAQRAVTAWPQLAALLASQQPDGHWGSGDFYLPRGGMGSLWVLTALGDMALPTGEKHARKGCELMLGHQREDGTICRRRREPGKGVVWQEQTEPCTQARICRLLIQFGYGEDPRLRKAVDWLKPIQRQDGMWFCREEGKHGFLRATLDVLRLAALDPVSAAWPGIPRAMQVVLSMLMQPRMEKYHVGGTWGTWECLDYPYYGINLVAALEALLRLGAAPDEPGIMAGMEYLMRRQLPDGAWPLDEARARMPLDFGAAGEPNRWVTLDVMRVLKMT